MRLAFLVAGATLACFSSSAFSADTPEHEWVTTPRDWASLLREDATALGDIIIDSHPGIHDVENPSFRTKVDESLNLALKRADTTSDAGGWWWALRAFVAGFDDGHVQIHLKATGFGFPTRWPGFLTAYRGSDHVVLDIDGGASEATKLSLGARLIACDGVQAEQLAIERIGAFRGRWFLESQRAMFGDWLFLSASNPWTPEMRHCSFESNGTREEIVLRWRPIEARELGARRARITRLTRSEFGIKILDDKGVWLTLPSFDGTPQSNSHASLTTILTELAGSREKLRSAPYIVLDLRGNGGGSSHWARELALEIWGEDWVEGHSPSGSMAADWRASAENIATIQHYLDEWTKAGEDAERITWARRIVDGMRTAKKSGLPYWRELGDAAIAPDEPKDAPPSQASSRVYVLTDPVCASACLDAVDFWKAMGAIQIGRETSADTVYMDVRDAILPSGLATVAIPMKVWRGRPRGNNVPHRPAHEFDGDMSSEAELTSWVRTLKQASRW